MEFVIFIILFIGVAAVTALLFSGWAVFGIIKVLAAGINALVSPPQAGSRTGHARFGTPPADRVRCTRARCHADNPVGARFCRRCGTSLTGYVPAAPAVRQRPSMASDPSGPRHKMTEPRAEAARQRMTL